MERFLRAVLGAVLVFSIVPGIAQADDSAAQADLGRVSLPAGTYAEHEAIACVKVEGSSGLGALSVENGILSSAEPLMDLSEEALRGIGDSEEGIDAAQPGQALQQGLAAQGAAASAAIVVVRDESKTTEQIIAELEADDRVLIAEPNWLFEEAEQPVGQHAAYDASQPVIDLTGFQWGFDNRGTLGGAASAGIDLGYAGWNSALGTTSDDVVVAVVDGGVDAGHPDLAGKMWTRAGYPALAGIGDEYGYSANSESTSTTDMTGHGTHCAGIIGAAWDGKGTSGISQNARIMSVKHHKGLEGILKCFNYIGIARDAGVNVRVASCSFGLDSFQSHILNAAVLEVGAKGVTFVFASGNECCDIDVMANNQNTLRDNPYAVVVDSFDPDGALTSFSNYGKTATDIMSPGTTILSTVPTDQADFLAEGDDEAVLYESYDGMSHADPAIAYPGPAILHFEDGVLRGSQCFDGDASLGFTYDPASGQGAETTLSDPLDLSGLADKPRYLSIRYGCEGLPEGKVGTSTVTVSIGQVDGTFATSEPLGQIGASGSAWDGYYIELPADTDFAHFQIRLSYTLESIVETGNAEVRAPAEGRVLIDSIGLGDTLIPYTYKRGTSMACPAISGMAAVLAETYRDQSAEKLAARIKGSVTVDASYDGICSTSGRGCVDAASDPAPSITDVSGPDADGRVTVEGYFFGASPSVAIGGLAGTVGASADLGDGKTALSVAVPLGFSGGNTEVSVANPSNGKSGRFFTHIGKAQTAAYYDKTDLPLFDGALMWGGWSLVGFDGMVYCLPRTAVNPVVEYDCIQRYDPVARTWTAIPLPTELMQGCALAGDVTATTWQGKLLLQISSADENAPYASYWTYGADGAWQQLAHRTDYDAMLRYGTLSSDGENVYLFGRVTPLSSGVKEVLRLDPATGDLTLLGSMLASRTCPQVAYRDGAFLVTGGRDAGGAELVTLSPAKDSVTSEAIDFSTLVTETGFLLYGGGATAEGFLVAGPNSDGGEADTYVLAPGYTLPIPYGKRASDHPLIIPAALGYRGSFYVFAASSASPYRVFSSTSVATLEQPGDAPVRPVDPVDPVDPMDPADPRPPSPGKPSGDGLAKAGEAPGALPLVAATLIVAFLAAAASAIAPRAIRRPRG